MFNSITSKHRLLKMVPIYFYGIMPLLFIVSLFFHKFAAIYVGVFALGLFLMARNHVRTHLLEIITSIPVRIMILFWLWSGVTLLWTLNFGNGIATWIKFFAMMILAILNFASVPHLKENQIKPIFYFILVSLMGIIAYYFLSMNSDQLGYQKPLAYFLALLFFPTLLFFGTTRNLWIKGSLVIFWILAIVVMKISTATSGCIGFVLGSLIFVLRLYRPYLITQILKVIVFVWTLATPLFMLIFNAPYKFLPYFHSIGTSLFARFCIWSFVTHKFFERPLLGWGLGSAKKFPGSDDLFFNNLTKEQLSLFDFIGPEIKEYVLSFKNLLLHPHNNALQVFLELGILGGVLYALFLASIFQVFMRVFKDKVTLATANAMAVLTLVIFNMSHSIWHMWLLAWIVISYTLLYAAHHYREMCSK